MLFKVEQKVILSWYDDTLGLQGGDCGVWAAEQIVSEKQVACPHYSHPFNHPRSRNRSAKLSAKVDFQMIGQTWRNWDGVIDQGCILHIPIPGTPGGHLYNVNANKICLVLR